MDSLLKQLFILTDVPRWFVYSVLGSGFLAYYYYKVVKPPVLQCSSAKYKFFLESNVPVVKEKFWPTVWCFESRLQTVLGSVFRGFPEIPYNREILQLKDGGEVALDWLHPANDDENTPVIVVLPGLTGSSSSSYIKGFALAGQEAGFRLVVFNNRGIGIELKTPQTYCASKSHDLIQVVHHVKNKYPNAPIGGMGVSLGGLILGNYLCRESPEERLFNAGMLISVPFDVFKATDSIEQLGLNYLLNKHLASCLTGFVKNLKHCLDGEDRPWKIEEVIASKTVREFDAKFTSKQFGYESVEDYYNDATLHNKLANIKTPVLCLNAADDPFQPLDELASVKHDHVGILVTARGGHIGFLEGLWPIKKRNEFMHRVFTQYFTAMFKDDTYKEFAAAN
ncbi:phospholipase ABHD3 [Planococcus citri]|uniref:phospholipase ABHD3 n=1 Tax=Planococcus citri TaxID=170843 RepID=UPI0031F724CB